MSFMKVGGKAILRKKTTETTATITAGVMNLNGTVTASTGYSYTQKISVKADDVIWYKNQNNGTAANYRYITAYNGETAVSSLGYDPGAQTNVPFIVPEGVDGIIITSGNTAYTIVRTTGDAYEKVFMFNDDGAVLESHIWNGKVTELVNQEIRNTSAIGKPDQPIDFSDFAINSLRINNTLDQAVNIRFYQEDVTSNPQQLSDINGNFIGFTVPANKKGIIVTADDLPILNYLNKLRIYMKCDTSPTTGAIQINVVSRR